MEGSSGYSGRVKKKRVTKLFSMRRNHSGAIDFFGLPTSAVKQMPLHVGHQEYFVRGMSRLVLVTIVFNCFNFYSIINIDYECTNT